MAGEGVGCQEVVAEVVGGREDAAGGSDRGGVQFVHRWGSGWLGRELLGLGK